MSAPPHDVSWPDGAVYLGRTRAEDGSTPFVAKYEDGTVRLLDGGLRPTGEPFARDVEWIAPVDPRKVVCVGRNYRAHAKELGNEVPTEPLLFLKPSTSVIAAGDEVVIPKQSQRVEHEGELAVVLAKRLTKASPEEAREAILGFTCANDVTARDIQRAEKQFTRAKGFDTFCPLGPHVVRERPGDEARVRVRVNGEPRQDGRVGDMVFGIDALLSFVSHVMTLEPFDVLLTGTPEGVGPVSDGDVIEVEIDGVGVLRNGVRAAR